MPDQNSTLGASDMLSAEQIKNIDELVSYVRMLSRDVHAVKGALAANTSITIEVAERQLEQGKAQADLAITQERTNALLEKMDVEKLIEIVSFADNVKVGGRLGASFVAWLGKAAKWVGGIAAAIVAIYALLHLDDK